MTAAPVRVIKVGGSLLGWPSWAAQFRRWLAEQRPAANVLVAGGGAIVEGLRELDRACPLPPEVSHWLAIRAMSLTAAIAAEHLGNARLVRTVDELRLSPEPSRTVEILDVEAFLRRQRGSPGALPCRWDVTSDSIAARVASALAAVELVLLKSTLLDEIGSLESAVARGYVDAHFAQAACSLVVRFVNLRDAQFAELAVRNLPAGS